MIRFFLLLLAMCVAIPAQAAELSGVNLPDSVEVDLPDGQSRTLLLNGLAMRSKFVFDVYVGALYLPAKVTTAQAVFAVDEPRRSEMHFLRSVDRESINEAWLDGLKTNTADPTDELKAKFDTLAGMMEDVEDGAVLLFSYIPGQGTEVSGKGAVKGVIPGKDFSDALLAAWIGEKPGPGQDFKKGILGVK